MQIADSTATRRLAAVQGRARPERPKLVTARRGILGILAICVIAEVVTLMRIVDPAFLPAFHDIVLNAGVLFGRPDFLLAIVQTMSEWAIALAITVVIGVVAGILIGLSDIANNLTRALIEIVRGVPAVMLIPLLVLVSGGGLTTILFVSVLAAVWTVLFNAITGVHGTNPLAKEMARSFGVTGIHRVIRIVLPSAAPFIMTGVRLASSIVLISAVTVELITGQGGLGSFIVAMQNAGGRNVVFVYSATLVAGLIGLVLNVLMERLERKFFFWERGAR